MKKITSVNFRHTIHVFYAIYFSKLKSPYSSNSEDLSALCPVESVYMKLNQTQYRNTALATKVEFGWPRGFRKLGWFSCAIYLEKSVYLHLSELWAVYIQLNCCLEWWYRVQWSKLSLLECTWDTTQNLACIQSKVHAVWQSLVTLRSNVGANQRCAPTCRRNLCSYSGHQKYSQFHHANIEYTLYLEFFLPL